MREIKFRAWHKEKKEIVNVEEIDFMNKVINYIDNDYDNVNIHKIHYHKNLNHPQ